MGGWTLPDLWSLDARVYRALVEWINETSRGDDDGSVDMDAVIEAKKAGDQQHGR